MVTLNYVHSVVYLFIRIPVIPDCHLHALWLLALKAEQLGDVGRGGGGGVVARELIVDISGHCRHYCVNTCGTV